mmetsp:Transcript_2629/g.2938  ORF Transcript_2629/g.2938 Transcript_2629/m.2938 type:complete len:194 (-) Transcript_2629:571-1152(-)|eukprot:CAMPEP_0197849746 /NCGR_PEP_ID=MMETSP1438-20131217/13112_1 /TAXON_ID=1461541 /ORGANISM="Pterosperma sp., Strain CCMP1384" /LENGTH=193 /DNA_ID=CAMNT_0043462577 /DNA_START=125 /DNA_END=706 /DNA_ORIENTATION=-
MSIHSNSKKGDVGQIEFNMQMGANVDEMCKDVKEKEYYGKTPLMIAAEHGKLQALKYLIDQGADVNKECMEFLKTPLHYACDGYRKDEKIDNENCIIHLSKKMAHSVPDRSNKLPDAGRGAPIAVERELTNAEARGRPKLAAIKEERKQRGRNAFNNAFSTLLDNASAATIVVCDSGDTEGYKYGGRGELPKF